MKVQQQLGVTVHTPVDAARLRVEWGGLFDFLHTGAAVLSLDLQRGDHQDFEPDWSQAA